MAPKLSFALDSEARDPEELTLFSGEREAGRVGSDDRQWRFDEL